MSGIFSGTWINIIITVLVVAIVLGVAFYYLNRWALKKTSEQNKLVDQFKQSLTIFVIDKVHDKASNVNLPNQVMEQLPKVYRFMKMYFVRAKVGPQIMTFICEKNIYNAVTVKKNLKVQVAGIYIVSIEGMKSDKQLKEIKKRKKKASK